MEVLDQVVSAIQYRRPHEKRSPISAKYLCYNPDYALLILTYCA